MAILTEKQIIEIRKANQIVKLVNTKLSEIAKPGVSLIELDDVARKLIREKGAEPAFLGYGGYPKSITTSVNNVLIHGIPTGYVLKDGDVLSIDTGAEYNGVVGDSAVSIHIGTPNPKAVAIVEAAKDALEQAVAIVKPGVTTGDIGYIIDKVSSEHGYQVTKDFVGHGIGERMHEDPQVPCYGKKGKGTKLEAGMVVCIEPMLIEGTNKTNISPLDGWTVTSANGKLTAHVEHAVLVTETGHEILDTLPK